MNKDTVFTLVQHDKIVSMTRGELLVGYEQGLVIYFYPKDNTP
jgi:peroxiredoxin